MKSINQEVSNTMDTLRERVINFRLSKIRNILDVETLDDMKAFAFQASKNDACDLDTTNPIVYASLLRDYIIEEKDFYEYMRPKLADFENVEYHELLKEIYETDFFHFLDEFSMWARKKYASKDYKNFRQYVEGGE